jgi:hypothetical protein
VLGGVGLTDVLGWWAAPIAIFVALYLRITLPITVGVYFAMVNVFEYPWWVGVLVAAPGLLLMIPGIIAEVIGAVTRRS